eukprot:TRINITY_DN8694_c0_g1::TRINITY_DN8694_c0_g1_i1::g.361::m.361 TRINITY_DN8694_c0_g1::TRINITY_DN8694_c0_g1_i1::g.361  ORF type:complete len:178 (+),score=3.48,DUF3611/PF12263.3/8.2e+02,DUF3611/PF12263.3/0.021 TRINITY_DN8694_c0_g1_i1:55-534(+)
MFDLRDFQSMFRMLCTLNMVFAMFACIYRPDGVNCAIAIFGLICSGDRERKNDTYTYIILLVLSFAVDITWMAILEDTDEAKVAFALVISIMNFVAKLFTLFYAWRYLKEISSEVITASGPSHAIYGSNLPAEPGMNTARPGATVTSFNPVAPSGYQGL